MHRTDGFLKFSHISWVICGEHFKPNHNTVDCRSYDCKCEYLQLIIITDAVQIKTHSLGTVRKILKAVQTSLVVAEMPTFTYLYSFMNSSWYLITICSTLAQGFSYKLFYISHVPSLFHDSRITISVLQGFLPITGNANIAISVQPYITLHIWLVQGVKTRRTSLAI